MKVKTAATIFLSIPRGRRLEARFAKCLCTKQSNLLLLLFMSGRQSKEEGRTQTVEYTLYNNIHELRHSWSALSQ